MQPKETAQQIEQLLSAIQDGLNDAKAGRFDAAEETLKKRRTEFAREQQERQKKSA